MIRNPSAATWFNMLSDAERQLLGPIFNQVLTTTEQYNSLIDGFQLYITGSSLNNFERSYNDIDLMVVLPSERINKIKSEILTGLRNNFQNKNMVALHERLKDPKLKLFGLTELTDSVINSLIYSIEITSQDTEALLRRLGSSSELNRIVMDPERELSAIKMRLDGELAAEKNNPTVEPDGTVGYQFGPMVEAFLNDVINGLDHFTSSQGMPGFNIQWNKSFPEGYGKVAGENNCHISSNVQCTPVHLFLTTGLDLKKAMEKKESFMLEYYSDQERMRPIKLY